MTGQLIDPRAFARLRARRAERARRARAARHLRVGAIFAERYRILGVAGRGGFATVYRVSDLLRRNSGFAHSQLAFKVPSRRDASGLAMIQREAQLLAALSHPRIVAFHDILRGPANLPFIISMEWLSGTTLRQLLRDASGRQLVAKRAPALIADAAAALAHLHDQGFIHGDVKPGNFIMLPDARLRMIDLATCLALPDCPMPAGSALATLPTPPLEAFTPRYASPQRSDGAQPDRRDDVYSLAVLAYELISGSHPFGRQGCREADTAPERLDDLDRRAWSVLSAALSFDAGDRPQHPAAVAEALRSTGRRHVWRWSGRVRKAADRS